MIVNHIYDWAEKQPGKPAIIHNDRPVSYAEFARGIDAVRGFLSQHEMPVGMTAVVTIQHYVHQWCVLLALRSLGMNTVCVESFDQAETLGLKDIGAVVTTAEQAARRKITRPRALGRRIITVPEKIWRGETVSTPMPIDDPERPYGGHILYTSGTTGDYKKVLLEGRHEEARAQRCVTYRHITADSVVHMLMFALWSGVGFKQALSVWHAGATVIADESDEPLRNVFRYQPSLLSMPPGVALELIAQTVTTRRPPVMPLVNLAGGFVSPKLLKAMRNAKFDRIMVSYGSTECSHVLRSNVESEDDIVWLAPVNDRRVEIVDEGDESCAVGQEGLLRVALLDHDAHGYLDDPETSASMFRDGFFYPGDLAVAREDGRIRILGRAGDVLNMQGSKMAAGPIEQQVRAALDLENVCLFQGVDAAGRDELVVAIEADAVPGQAMIDHVTACFPTFERVRFAAVPHFPRTTSGLQKIKRLELRKMVFGPGQATTG